ncbi:MAG: class I SAM-dependent methyltransferase [Candidatus Levybacteria bacterium]|nr:class I SAM-dependent methyltransferase [Candidatus Levybacteria bacterium]
MRKYSPKKLEEIWREVPVDYYQKSVKNNILQRIWHKKRLELVIRLLNESSNINKDNTKILDVGCAGGWFISSIFSHFPKGKYYGIDVYKDAIIHAKKIYPHISFSCADGHDLPFQKETFDLVICTNVLEHVKSPERIMSEIKRVLTQSGLVIIGIDSENIFFKTLWFIWKKFKGKIWKDAHLHKYKVKDLEKLFKKTGFIMKEKKFSNLGMFLVFKLTKSRK